MPKSIRDNRVSFIFNLAIVFIVGLMGNILTLAAFPYAWIYYRNSFPGVLTFTVTKAIITTLKIITFLTSTISAKVPISITVLILHLTLCGLLNCIIKMPYQMSNYSNGYLK